MSPTPLLSASPATVPRGRVDYARPPPDTSPRQTTTEATTTDPRHAKHLHTMGAPRPGTVRRAPLGTSPRVHPSTAHQGPLTEDAGAALHPGTAWRATCPSTSVTTSTSGIMSPLPTSKASLMATHTRMGEILTHTHAHLGLPATGLLRPLTRIHVGCPTATGHPHPLHIGGDLLGHRPPLTTAPPMLEGPVRACMNLIVRRTRMTGASNHWEQGIRVLEEKNSSLQCPGFGYVDF